MIKTMPTNVVLNAITFIENRSPVSSLNKNTCANDIDAWNTRAIYIVRPLVARMSSPIIMRT